jgi:hypothetical protein
MSRSDDFEIRQIVKQALTKLIASERRGAARAALIDAAVTFLAVDGLESTENGSDGLAVTKSPNSHRETEAPPSDFVEAKAGGRFVKLQIIPAAASDKKPLKPVSSLVLLQRMAQTPTDPVHRSELVAAIHQIIPSMTTIGAQKMVRVLRDANCIEETTANFFKMTSRGWERLASEQAEWKEKVAAFRGK